MRPTVKESGGVVGLDLDGWCGNVLTCQSNDCGSCMNGDRYKRINDKETTLIWCCAFLAILSLLRIGLEFSNIVRS